MKPGIHPEYMECTVRCSCGNTFVTRSTVPEIRVELCNECHPFYTGQQKFVDTGGRVQRFADKFGGAAQAALEREAAKKAARAKASEEEQAKKAAAREAKAAEKAKRAEKYAAEAAKKAARPLLRLPPRGRCRDRGCCRVALSSLHISRAEKALRTSRGLFCAAGQPQSAGDSVPSMVYPWAH